MKPIRILLAEDHTLVRSGVRSLLEKLSGIEVVGEAADGREALELLKTQAADVALLDISMPGMNGLDAAAHVTRRFPMTRVIVLSMHANEEYVHQALRAGAAGYLLKDAGTAELELAVRAVARGQTYLSPAISKQVVSEYVRRTETSSLEALTPRQREVLQMIAEGCTTKEIAKKLDCGVKTVETHRTQLMGRLDIHDMAGLVRYAIRSGLVDPGK
ncbi:MAG: response regulator [Thermoanaerobaculia bacterium]